MRIQRRLLRLCLMSKYASLLDFADKFHKLHKAHKAVFLRNRTSKAHTHNKKSVFLVEQSCRTNCRIQNSIATCICKSFLMTTTLSPTTVSVVTNATTPTPIFVMFQLLYAQHLHLYFSYCHWCMDMCCTADQDPVWWQEFCRGWSGTVYRLHCVTLAVFTASESSWRHICLVAAATYSDYVFLRITNTPPYFLLLLMAYSSWVLPCPPLIARSPDWLPSSMQTRGQYSVASNPPQLHVARYGWVFHLVASSPREAFWLLILTYLLLFIDGCFNSCFSNVVFLVITT